MIVDTLLLRAVDCLVFFYFCAFQQCSVLSKVKVSFAVVLIWGQGQKGAFYS